MFGILHLHLHPAEACPSRHTQFHAHAALESTLVSCSSCIGQFSSASTAEGSVQCDDGQDSVGISVDQDTGGLRALPDNGSAGGVERRYPSLARILVRGGAAIVR